MNIAGIGIVFTRGRGIRRYEEALHQGWVSPAQVEFPSISEKRLLSYTIEQEVISDKAILSKIRRADRFSKMAVLAAWDAVVDSGIQFQQNKGSLGIILSTAFGPHATTFRFLDDILDYGDGNVSPTIFSHSVHNAAASYIASVLDNHGPTITVTQFTFSFQQALILAQAWIQEGRCEYVLLGSVDESASVLNYICSRKLRIAQDGKIRPFNFSEAPSAVPGEGSVFFLVSSAEDSKRYCQIHAVSSEEDNDKPDMYILDADGMAGDERVYRNTVKPGVSAESYTPIFGSMMTGSSFHCAAGALMLKNQIRYASPVQDNPYGLDLCRETEQAGIKSIQCVRYNCLNEKSLIGLKR